MNKMTSIIALCAVSCYMNCALMINGPDQEQEKKPGVVSSYKVKTNVFFPFENSTNWWKFTDETGNHLNINVTDTISDDNIMFYRVSFMENRVDTTDDWFKKISGDIMFGLSLTGSYNKFLPASVDSKGGAFSCGSNQVSYTFHDSAVVNGMVFRKVLDLRYSVPIIHGFDQIMLAESVGIILMKDIDGRWPVSYSIDSCSVSGIVKRYR